MTVPDLLETPLAIQLFGPFEVRVNGAPLPRLRSRKGLWLLALLTLRHGQEVERDWLAGTLWPEGSPAQAFHNLRVNLSDLRRALGQEACRLRSSTRHTLSLDLAAAAVDVRTFDAALREGDEASLEGAVSLYRGPLLEGCAEEWAFQERQAREQAYLTALEELAGLALARGEATEAERCLRLAVAADPLRESAQRALMAVLAAGGNYAAALLVYRELRLRLHRELNAEPDPETETLFQQIRAEARRLAGAGRREGSPRRSPADADTRDTETSSEMEVADPERLSGRRSHRGPAPGVVRCAAEYAPPPLRVSVVNPSRPTVRIAPEDTLTFLFTDIEGSTRLWEEQPEAMQRAVACHDRLLRETIGRHGGEVFKTFGDQCCAVFGTAPAALAAAAAAQHMLHAERWEETGPLRVRMALHTGMAQEREGDYFGPALNRIARLLEVAPGGQVLLSRATQELVRDALPEGADLLDLGEHWLKELVRPEQIYQLLHRDLPGQFPPLHSSSRRRHNLPAPTTVLLGREEAVAELVQWLQREEVRLLTLTGPGGSGKTRLGLQVAAELLGRFAAGVFLVELAPLRDPHLVTATLAQGSSGCARPAANRSLKP